MIKKCKSKSSTFSTTGPRSVRLYVPILMYYVTYRRYSPYTAHTHVPVVETVEEFDLHFLISRVFDYRSN